MENDISTKVYYLVFSLVMYASPKTSTKATNERREKLWFLMLRGHFRQSIIRILRTTETVVYKDIKFLNEKSREYVFDMAKGIHTLIYQRSIEGINETLQSVGVFIMIIRTRIILTSLRKLLSLLLAGDVLNAIPQERQNASSWQ